MKKKFKVRVRLHSGTDYCVQYAYYYFIPFYHTIKGFYHGSDFVIGITGWSAATANFIHTELFAKTFNSIIDVADHNHKELERERIFYKNRKEHRKIMTPYYSKEIKHGKR